LKKYLNEKKEKKFKKTLASPFYSLYVLYHDLEVMINQVSNQTTETKRIKLLKGTPRNGRQGYQEISR